MIREADVAVDAQGNAVVVWIDEPDASTMDRQWSGQQHSVALDDPREPSRTSTTSSHGWLAGKPVVASVNRNPAN
ncbi:MAG: hypothetical protein ACXVH1_38950 [Solirubrobacteraceae bacterium]